MLRLEGFTHRDELSSIVTRCIIDKRVDTDIRRLKEIVNFNSYMLACWLPDLARRILGHVFGPNIHGVVASQKGHLKNFIAESPWYESERISEMLRRFRRYPMDFYLETPYEGRVFYQQRQGKRYYIGSVRQKRFRRIAEKGSRRIVDFMFDRVREGADRLASERADQLGIPKHRLITSHDQQVAEFVHAEFRVLKAIRQGTIQRELPTFSIPDIAGIKIVVEDPNLSDLLGYIDQSSDLQLVEVERHRGRYNATNMQMYYTLPKDELLSRSPDGELLRLFAERGFDTTTVVDRYCDFVRKAEAQVMVELICANYESTLESEIGNAMHEERVFTQRSAKDYQGHLAINIMHLMDYLLNLCLSDITEVSDLPIKLWVRYMPDYFEQLHRELFHFDRYNTFNYVVGQREASAAKLRAIG